MPGEFVPSVLCFLKSNLGYSSLDCFFPTIPPGEVPLRVNWHFELRLITGVLIKIVPPLLFKVFTASHKADSSSVVIVAISSSSANEIKSFSRNLEEYKSNIIIRRNAILADRKSVV